MDTIHVIVEIPKGSRNKYEIDHVTQEIFWDRRLMTATAYPAEYGFVPDTLAEDGDPLDVLVIVSEPTFPGCHIHAVPLGMLTMADENGPDHKLIAVPEFVARERGTRRLEDLPDNLLAEFRHFFQVYKDLDHGKMSEVGDYQDAEAAWREIAASRARHDAEEHPE